MSSETFLKEMENLFLALADKTRLRLLNLMRESEVCVCFFTEVLGESQPKISRHLAYLRNAGLVSARRDGKWMHYKIAMPADFPAAEILQKTLEGLRSKGELQEDYDKLVSVCCASDVPVTIARAPKPETFAEPDITLKPKEELETYLL